ncbi:hypothetical protein AV521_00090 [Streptomyces sp. IMTB 2501]|uniref:hypothetical protein n=1 Tax=Streptomyces sp. IMTB 2501 TaxID=1776340 RepID=UPI00096E74B5|nr:hypothetical protein [Streptomyces sp. IMTB 2501]OLZ74143.1 hypothetical protein AV521_00090 [Streptomyces sp. IMTB 2501]
MAPSQYRALRRTGEEAHAITGRAMIRVLDNTRVPAKSKDLAIPYVDQVREYRSTLTFLLE